MVLTDEMEFQRDCLYFLKSMELDMWFDPMAGFNMISDERSCQQQWNAFKALHNDSSVNSQDVSEYLGASYMASLSLNLDASLHKDYDECVNLEVLDNPNSWALEFLQDHAFF